jgi:hypothetical protein
MAAGRSARGFGLRRRRADARAVAARCRAGQSDLAEGGSARLGSGRVAASWHWWSQPQWPVFAEYVLGAGELGPPVNAMLSLEASPLGSFVFDEHGLGDLVSRTDTDAVLCRGVSDHGFEPVWDARTDLPRDHATESSLNQDDLRRLSLMASLGCGVPCLCRCATPAAAGSAHSGRCCITAARRVNPGDYGNVGNFDPETSRAVVPRITTWTCRNLAI